MRTAPRETASLLKRPTVSHIQLGPVSTRPEHANTSVCLSLNVEVEVELVGVGPRADSLVVLHLELHHHFEEVAREDGGEELRVAPQALDGLREAPRQFLHREFPPPLGCQLVDVLVHRVPPGSSFFLTPSSPAARVA